MATLIDDATATDYFNRIDTAPEDQRQQMADDLLAWGKAKKAQEYNDTEEHFSKLFTDEAYFEQEKRANAAVQESPDPDQAAKRTLIGAWLQHRNGRPIDTMSYQVERDAYAIANYGKKNLDDNQLFDFISGEYNTQKKKTEAINDLQMQAVGKAITDSQLGQNRPFVDGMTEVFNQWQQKYPELVDGKNDAAFLSQGYKLYYDTINDLDTVRPQASKALSTLTSFTQGNATDEDMQSLANDFVGAPPEDRQKIYKYVTLAAQAGQIDRAGIEQFAINMGQAFTRGFDFVPQGSLQLQEAGVSEALQAVQKGGKVWVPQNGDITKATISEKTPVAQTLAEAPTAFLFSNPKQDYREATPEEAGQFTSYAKKAIESFKVVRELRNVAKTGVDPIRPVLEENSFWGTAERGAYGLSGSIPLMGATAVNPFLGVLAYQSTEYDRIMLENPDINPQFAQGLALVEGAANAAIDRVQLSSISGRLPMFGRYLDRIASDGVRRTVKIGANVVEQNLQEGAQDLIAPVLETAVAALRDDMPDKDFTKLMDDWSGQRAETFFATLPLSLIGGGIATYRDIKNPSAELNATKLRMAGFGKDQVTFIQRAENPEEYDARIKMEWEKRTPENIEAGRQEVIAEMEKAATPDENSAKLSETVAEDGTRRWTVTTPDGKELLQTQDQQAALDAIAQHGNAQLLNNQFEALYEPEELRQMISDLSNQWTSQASKNTLVMESEGMNAQQELEQLQAAGNASQIQELHNRIANSPMKDTPYEQINILGKASVDDVAEMVFGSLIKINPNTRPENLREEIHHIGVKVAIKNGSVTLDTLRGWLDATEKALPGTFQNLVRDSEGDIVESLAQVQAAYENGKINADEETKLPPSFIGYIKNMMRTLAEVMRRAVALRGAFKDGVLPAEYESFLADSVGLNQQARVDTASKRVRGELTQGLFNYSIGQQGLPVYTTEQKYNQIIPEIKSVDPSKVSRRDMYEISEVSPEVAKSMKFDQPVEVSLFADGTMMLSDGHHRLAAAKQLGMSRIPAVVRSINAKGKDINALIAQQVSDQPVSTDTNYSIGKVDETTGLPLNPNGTVTVYHGTTKESAAEIQRTGILKSAGEPDVYFTTAKEGTGYGDGTVVGVEIDPKQLILDDEFPDGRRDFRVNVGKSKNLAVKLSQSAPNWHSSPDEFQKHWTDRGVVNSTQIYGGGKYIKPGKIIVGEGSRNSGLGTEFMRDLTAFADSKGMQIRVTPSKDFGATSVDRLKKFYKRFGFVENSGRNKDFEISDTMYRNPAPGATNYSIGIAPNGNTSNLKPEDQALARSPEFKARFGDWEALASLDKNVAVVVVKDDGLVGATIKELRKNAIQQTRSWWGSRERNTDLDADILINRDTLEHLFTHRGPIQVHAALHVPEIIRSARKVSDEEHEPASKSIAKVHRLVSAINFRGSIYRVDIVVKEHSAPRGHHAYDIEAITVKTETAEKGLPSGASSAKRIGTSAVSILKVRDLDIGVNPESVIVKTDENGEPLASEIARFRQETGTSSYSIASQSEIDRVNKALGGMNRGPDERLKVYQRAKQKFSKLMAWNSDELAAMADTGSDDSQIRRTQILQGLGELDGILSVLPPEVRGRVGGYTKLAGIAPMDVFKDGR
jgi:hypothetical protein